MLQIIDVKLSAEAPRVRLDILIDIMKTYECQYDGVGWIGETIKHLMKPPGPEVITQDARFGTLSDASVSRLRSWTDILSTQPVFFLKLLTSMDLSLSQGRLPKESDFPEPMRQLFSNIPSYKIQCSLSGHLCPEVTEVKDCSTSTIESFLRPDAISLDTDNLQSLETPKCTISASLRLEETLADFDFSLAPDTSVQPKDLFLDWSSSSETG